jgi:hypothetical protein
MSVQYDTQMKNARMTATRDQFDAGGAAGRLEICSAGYAAILATITLGYPGAATGTVSGGVLTLAGFPRSDTAADNTGTAAVARIKRSDGTTAVNGLTVGVGSGDVQLDSLNITQGQTVEIAGATITHAA